MVGWVGSPIFSCSYSWTTPDLSLLVRSEKKLDLHWGRYLNITLSYILFILIEKHTCIHICFFIQVVIVSFPLLKSEKYAICFPTRFYRFTILFLGLSLSYFLTLYHRKQNMVVLYSPAPPLSPPLVTA